MKRVYIETYGCQMNVADTELMLGVLGRDGFVPTDSPEDADVLLVNTCAVRDNAEQRVIGRVGELQRHRLPGRVIGVVGCMAQRLGPILLERGSQVDLVAGPDAYRNLPALVREAGNGERVVDTTFRSCTFCVVPMTRGPERSRKLEDVTGEVERLAATGTTEVTLLGQTVNSYHDGTNDFGELLRAVGRVPGIRRLRFTSPYPTDFTDSVIAAMAEVPAVCEHVHLPVQSGSNAVLRRMLRRYTREAYLDVVAKLRQAIPGITFSTDIIVGFPGETEAQFEETLSLVAEAGFDDAYTFRYSPRDGTPAMRMLQDAVPDDAGSARMARLVAAVRAQARARHLGRVGEKHEVLIERAAKRGGMLGRTRTNLLVLLDVPESAIGEYHHVRLTGTTGSTFIGSLERTQLAVLA